ncbi:MAG TPA: vanadium-dependent haloperoxidase [Usitatibacter sp.]|nr:vanadium-dependent haloperoxidase [Usitatibacter sp.]
MRAIAWAAACAAGLVCISARADLATDWCEKATSIAYQAAPGTPSTTGSRIVTMAHVAMFEAVNSIDRRYAPYKAYVEADPQASREAALSAAAHAVLVKSSLNPDKAREYEAFHQAVLAKIPDGPAKAAGIAVGERAAESILAERANDGSNPVNDYRPATTPGVYVPTQMPAAINWFKVKPFAMARADQFRSPPPYALASPEWARDFNEVKRMGAKAGSARNDEQSRIAKFWEFTGPGTYMPLATGIVKQKSADLTDSARVLALVSMASFDAAIAVFDAKYAYNFWRPVTAIRNGDRDGNDATDRDDRWESFIPTPMHPEYPCAHCTMQGAAAAALRGVYGNEFAEVRLVSTSAPGVERGFTRLTDYVDEVVNARIYDGVHYRASGEAGAELGRRVGEYTVAQYLKPAR